MRRLLRPLLLVAIALIVAVVAGVYFPKKGLDRRLVANRPEPLPSNTTTTAPEWAWEKTDDKGRAVIRLSARDFREITNPSRLLLSEVEVRLLDSDGLSFDRIRTAKATFDKQAGELFAAGEVVIITGEPAVQGETGRRRVEVHTSGLTFQSSTQRAYTDSRATFAFENGQGSSSGVSYDPALHETVLRSEPEIEWRGSRPDSAPIKIQAGQAIYREKDQAFLLSSSCQFQRGNLEIRGESAGVYLKNGAVDHILAFSAHGSHRTERGRQVDFSAGELLVEVASGGEIQRINGSHGPRLVSTDISTITTVTGDTLTMEFDLASGESRLKTVFARERGTVEAKPLPSAPQRETRTLRSDFIELRMRPGGSEIDSLASLAPGVAEFIPNTATQRRRRMEADSMSMLYGDKNQVKSMQAARVATRTQFPKPANRPAQPPLLTWSRELAAEFSPDSGEVTHMEQRGDFRFEQGDRKGSSASAALGPKDVITLQGAARASDSSGSLSADTIVTDQNTGDLTATGNVTSTRQPDRSSKPSAIVSEARPFQARAARMSAPGSSRLIRYEGDVVLWQGGNRIEAAWAEIDRDKHTLAARGNVVCRLLEERGSGGTARSAPVATLIRAAQLLYTDDNRTALFTGGVATNREGLTVDSSQLRGVFTVNDGNTQLETAYADGNVQVLQKSQGRIRKGAAEHAEYRVPQAVVVLYGGTPWFEDSARGIERGDRLTWYQDMDRLVVEGRKEQRTSGQILRKSSE
jgi:lipopolysaccharide export system protein LptA